MTDAQTYFRVERLLADYARAIDDDRLEDWPDFFAARLPLQDHLDGEL